MNTPCNCTGCHQSQSQTAFGSSVSGSSSFVFPSALPLEPSNQCTCGATTAAFGGQSFSFGGQSTAPAFQSSGFGASSMPAFGSTTMSGSFESPFQQSQPGFSLSITFPSSPCGPTHFEVSSQPASKNTSAAFGQCVGLTVTPFYDTAPKSTAFTSPPACIQMSVHPCSSSTSTNQSDPKKSSFFTPFQSAPSRFCPIHDVRQSPLRCQCAVSRVASYDQTPQAHNCTNTTPKSTDNTFGPECTQKSVNPCSSSTSTNVFSPVKSTSSNPAQSTPFGFFPNHGSPFAENLVSISAMPAYKEKSHEELRCEDYLLGDKGGPTRSNMQSTSFTFTPAISHTHANPFYSFTSTEPCVPKTSISQTLSVSVGSRVTPYAQTSYADNGSFTASNSTGFYFPHLCSKPVNQSNSFPRLFGTLNGQTPQADNGSDTTPKSTGFAFSPACSKPATFSSSTTFPSQFGTPSACSKSAILCSSTTSPGLFGTPYAHIPQADNGSGAKPVENQLGERGVQNCVSPYVGGMASSTNNTESVHFTFPPGSQIPTKTFTSSPF